MQLGLTPANGSLDGNSTHSPGSGTNHRETSKQYIGTWSGTLATPALELDFVDWPATIAIDNLRVDMHVPEPGAIGLFSAAVLAMGGLLRRRLRTL
jgi:hypothetical protein